jgi:hypothetical protein
MYTSISNIPLSSVIQLSTLVSIHHKRACFWKMLRIPGFTEIQEHSAGISFDNITFVIVRSTEYFIPTSLFPCLMLKGAKMRPLIEKSRSRFKLYDRDQYQQIPR